MPLLITKRSVALLQVKKRLFLGLGYRNKMTDGTKCLNEICIIWCPCDLTTLRSGPVANSTAPVPRLNDKLSLAWYTTDLDMRSLKEPYPNLRNLLLKHPVYFKDGTISHLVSILVQNTKQDKKKHKMRKQLKYFQRRHIYGQYVHEKELNIINQQRNANSNHTEISLHTY